MVPTERKKVEAYIRRLSKNIKGEVTSSDPATLNKAVRMAHTLMEQKVKAIARREADNKKRKWENFQEGSSSGGNNNSNRNNNNYNNNQQGNARAMTNIGNQNTNEAGQNVKCNRCGMQHYPIKCNKCGKIGHKARDCWSKVVATGANAQPIVTCYECGEKGHIKTNCPARNNPGRNRARGQAYALRDSDQNLGPNVVTGTFLHNNRYARVLFDSGSDKSFFLGLAGYYRRFIEGFSLIAKPLTELTQKNKTYEWGKEKEEAFQLLKDKLCSAPILALPKGFEDSVVYCDASLKGYGAVLM
nr:reverse transcriptase domain-containing protein [Tanacetum cinerariifolium]